MRRCSWIFSVLVLLAWSVQVPASDTLRVGSRVLTAGDNAARVLALLGRPAYRSHRTASRSRYRGDASRRSERWQYNRGDHVTVVTLVGGKVADIEDHRR